MSSNNTSRQSIFATMSLWMLCGLYLLFSIGVVKATHFCMGREASVSYFTAESKKCPCSMFAGEKDGCCSDEHDLLKLEDSQKNFQGRALPMPMLVLVGEVHNTFEIVLPEKVAWLRCADSVAQPPPKPLFKIHCSYVFYDDKSVA